MQKITNVVDSDQITGFVGFNNPVNINKKSHDLLEFDEQTFTNYSANQKVEQTTVAAIQATSTSGNKNPAENKFIVDTVANINNANLSNTGVRNILALSDAGVVAFSQNGNFKNNFTVIGTITDFSNFVAAENVVIV